MSTTERICRFCEKPEGEQGCREEGPCVGNHYKSQGCAPYISQPLSTLGSASHAPARIEDVHRRSAQYAAALGELKQKIRTPFASTLSHEEALERLRQINLLSY